MAAKLKGFAVIYWSLFRRLISKSAFMQFWTILTFLHIWQNENQGYFKKHGP